MEHKEIEEMKKVVQGTLERFEKKVGPKGDVNEQLLPGSNPNWNHIVIALGASTGGTDATLEVIKNLPETTPGIVIVQHMPEGFTSMYAKRLDSICRMNVKEAKHGDRIRAGQILVAQGGLQLRVVKSPGGGFSIACDDGEKVSGHKPSVDVLFQSVADAVGKNAIGIILTGMGKDGAEGLLRMRNKGAFTIGQDEKSSVVYGMPKAAHEIGAVARQGSLREIADILMNYLERLQ